MNHSSQKGRISSIARTLISTALLAVSAQAACVSLTGSKACPEYASFSVDTNVPRNIAVYDEGVNMTAFTDVASFDAAILSATGFMTTSSCTGYSATEKIRYQTSLLCTLAVLDRESQECKSNPPTLCASSCTLYANSLTEMVNRVCPTVQDAKEKAAAMTALCVGGPETWGGLHDTDGTCVNATTNEAATC
ncbi:hypothetical protein BX616_005649, partial [Lobosporangium transversale]